MQSAALGPMDRGRIGRRLRVVFGLHTESHRMGGPRSSPPRRPFGISYLFLY